MDFGHEKVGMNVEDDRLSRLPDDVIHTILSLVSLREAIRTCVLSSRWRFIWTSIPCLNFSDQDLSPQFVSNVLYHRNNQLQLSSVKVVVPPEVSHESVKGILDYASSHNNQQLTIMTGDSLTSDYIGVVDLSALTTLHLHYITLSDDNYTCLFSKWPNLKHLSLVDCRVMEMIVLNICHPRLSNLTLEHSFSWLEVVKVVAPQLKNLTIKGFSGKEFLISASGLTSLVIKGFDPFQLIPTQGFPSLEKVDLCFRVNLHYTGLHQQARKLACLLNQLHNVKFLTLNLGILQILSSSMEPVSHQPSPFANLNILKFLTCPATVYMELQPHENVATSTEIKNNMQDSFSSAIITMISREVIIAMRNIASAQGLVQGIPALVQQCKTYRNIIKTNYMGYINGGRDFENELIEMNARRIEESIVTKMQRVERLLTGLPVSKSLAVQAIFSRVCEEADVVTKNVLECTKIQYNKKSRCFSV